MKAIIVEDESLILNDINNIISNNSTKIEVVQTFTNGVDVISYLNDNDIDVIFIDINIPLLDGMCLARTICKFEKKPYIIFITAYKEYAAEAFEVHAFDYILKPYSVERIKEVIERIEGSNCIKEIARSNKNILSTTEDITSSVHKKVSKLKVKDKNNNISILDIEDIYFLKVKDKSTFIYTKNCEYEVIARIIDLEEQILKEDFFRCHRSFIVNLKKIKSIESSGVSSFKLRLEDIDDEVPVGRRKMKDLKSLLELL